MFDQLLAQFGRDLIDVIREVRNAAGERSYVTEIVAAEATRVPGMTLTRFAREQFGHGRLRKVGKGIYAVLRSTPPAVQTIPTWAYHVA